MRFRSEVEDDKAVIWGEIELQNFFIGLVRYLPLPPVVIFIDALDEGCEDDIRRMLRFFQRLTKDAAVSLCSLRIYLSSRHYPNITIGESMSLVVEDQVEHGQDIDVYISAELTKSGSSHFDDIRSKIRDRSAGVFLWVVLIIPILNKAHDKGESPADVFRKLEVIPTDLYDIFAQILSKDFERFNECRTLLEWVLFSARPLSPLELYCAVQQNYPGNTVDEDEPLDADLVARYLLDCSRTLIEIAGSETLTVQFVHDTVRNYLLDDKSWKSRQADAYIPDTFLPSFRAEICHANITENCSHHLRHACDKAPSTARISEEYPLAKYAASYWWRHWWKSEQSCTEKLVDLALGLFTEHESFLKWTQPCKFEHKEEVTDVCELKEGEEEKRPLHDRDYISPLYYAAWIGNLSSSRIYRFARMILQFRKESLATHCKWHHFAVTEA